MAHGSIWKTTAVLVVFPSGCCKLTMSDLGNFEPFSEATTLKNLSLGSEYVPEAVINEDFDVAST